MLFNAKLESCYMIRLCKRFTTISYRPNFQLVIGMCLSLTCLSANAVFAAQINLLPKPEKISPHVYAWIGPHGGPNTDNKGFRMNMAFVVGKDSVAVIESGFYPAMAKAMIKHIQSITDLPIKYVINSNSQPDRFFGNDAFHQLEADIIAHKKEIKRMNENVNMYAMFVENSMKFKKDSIKVPKNPNRPIEDNTEIDLGGGVKLAIHCYKGAHTPAPLIIHIPSDNVVYAGDILYSGRLLAIVPGGNIAEWLETFNYLRKFKSAVFIPGHGKPGPLASFEKSTYDYLQLLNKHMVKMVSDGVDMQDAINRLDQSKFSKLENYKDLAGRNANRAYQEAERAFFN